MYQGKKKIFNTFKIFQLPKYNPTKKIEVPIGLFNKNLNCYMNSVIQCLFHMTKFRDYFINEKFSEDDHPISLELKNIFKKLKNRNGGKPFYLNRFKELMGEYDDSFSGSNGADAYDLLSYIVSGLSAEQTNYIGLDISMMSQLDINQKESVFKDCQEKVGDETALKYIVNYIQTEYKCNIYEKKISYAREFIIPHKSFFNFEHKFFLDFNLDELLDKRKTLNLNEIFNYYFNKNNISDEFCPKCNKNIKCETKTSIYKTSDYLIIILNQKRKNKIKINFDENINIRNFVEEYKENKNEVEYNFRLVGVILYIGDATSYGHYVSCCRNTNNENKQEKVYLFNDAKVKEFQFEQIEKYNFTPYILFYEKYSNFNLKYKVFIKSYK